MSVATQLQNGPVAPAVTQACDAIAPAWPLDRFIAVNPFWGHVHRPLPEVAAHLGSLSGARLLMDMDWFRRAWQEGEFGREHLDRARRADSPPLEAVIEALDSGGGEEPPEPLPLLSDIASMSWQPAPGLGWSASVSDQVSRFCALHFGEEADWRAGSEAGLYAEWRAHFLALRGNVTLTGHPALRGRAARLPEDPDELIEQALQALELPESLQADYLLALLLSVNGWASWCAWRRWQAGLEDGEDDSLRQLLAIRLAWDWLLDDRERGTASAHGRWLREWRAGAEYRQALHARQQTPWLCQRALELAWQEKFAARLRRPPVSSSRPPQLQAVFCIDVRSEVLRRALEACHPDIETRGFAGFFGLPVAYRPLGTDHTRAQLPGLLAPKLEVTERGADGELAEKRRSRLAGAARWKRFEYAPGSIFTMVESLGIFHAGKLVARSLGLGPTDGPPDGTGLTRREIGELRPALAMATPEQGAELAAGVLTAMGLTGDFAPVVLLVGHGSQSANNPHAAGLDCGACCGQTGEVNARALAGLLNDPEVRAALRDHDIEIPTRTRFLAALHNTTTDEVELFDTDQVAPEQQAQLEQLREWLERAGDAARAERAPALGLEKQASRPAALKKALRRRARDWGQVRPEWGLANNAAFIAAPRARTRGLDLGGRAFLHDYDWQTDRDFAILGQIMTAPMVVAHWINLQYYASTVDNERYGSGNKVLHNVVGARLGVLEGNGGDLRIGLPWQSLHDGERLMHQPLRLSVFIEAPAAAIAEQIERHETVRHLVENDWLHLFRIDSDTGSVAQYRDRDWQAFTG